MLKNYFKVAFRHLWRNKFPSIINIVGLSIGLAVCLLITLFVVDEWSYDRYNVAANRIIRINTDWVVNGNVLDAPFAPPPMGPALVKEYPYFENEVRIKNNGFMSIKKVNETVVEPNCFFADPGLFEVFTLPMIAGNPKTALVQPNSIVLSEQTAKKYFNSTNIIGKTLLDDNSNVYNITGVIKDVPAQSHFHFHIIKAISGWAESQTNVWLNPDVTTYLLLKPGVSEKTVNTCVAQLTRKYLGPQIQTLTHSSLDALVQRGDRIGFTTIPLTRIHLYSTFRQEFEPSGSVELVYVFIIIAALILLIACFNFVNLATAFSAGRAKEIGVRKVLGSDRSGLIVQFQLESVLTCLFAAIVALFISFFLLPFFNNLSGKQISLLHLLSSWWIWPATLLVPVVVGLLAGIYPAFFLSSLLPTHVLKGKFVTDLKGSFLRNSLVIMQFTAANILIIGTMVIYSQLGYIRNKKLGYNREQVLVIKNISLMGSHTQAFKDQVLQIPGVQMATATSVLPTSSNWEDYIYFKDPSLHIDKTIPLSTGRIDADYIRTMGMEMAKGRDFSPIPGFDSSSMIINETAASLLGYADPLNQSLYEDSIHVYHIIGVVRDFNVGSLRNKTKPIALTLSGRKSIMAFRINTENTAPIIDQVKNRFYGMDRMEGQPFSYSFLDDVFNNLYRSEQRSGKLISFFAFLAILIGCMGLFGLITFATGQRAKEIGIRKVLGAGTGSIMALLSRNFLFLILVAILISFPLSWWAMNQWLQNFAYRTNIKWWVFAIAGISSIAITLLTISVQTLKAALSNPIGSLRSE